MLYVLNILDTSTFHIHLYAIIFVVVMILMYRMGLKVYFSSSLMHEVSCNEHLFILIL
jgi:hypothetical protein